MFPKMSKEDQEFHRAADLEIAFLENLKKWTEDDNNLDHADQTIARNVEDEFGIQASIVFQFLQAGACQESTFESICKSRLCQQEILKQAAEETDIADRQSSEKYGF